MVYGLRLFETGSHASRLFPACNVTRLHMFLSTIQYSNGETKSSDNQSTSGTTACLYTKLSSPPPRMLWMAGRVCTNMHVWLLWRGGVISSCSCIAVPYRTVHYGDADRAVTILSCRTDLYQHVAQPHVRLLFLLFEFLFAQHVS